MAIRSLVAACLCWSAIAAGQTSVAAKTDDVKEAYQIYSLLLSHEESFQFRKGPADYPSGDGGVKGRSV